MSRLPDGLFFDLVSSTEVEKAYELEVFGYPPDEAATLETFQQRESQAPSLFLGAFLPSSPVDPGRQLIGYVCSTLSPSSTLTLESMSKHEPGDGPSSVCIHSVCVSPNDRRRGIALALLKEYIQRLVQTNSSAVGEGPYARILLITHDDLRGLYEKAGFDWVGKSPVAHGSKPWFEMRKTLMASGPTLDPSPSSDQMDSILAALRQSNRKRPVPRQLKSFDNITDVIEVEEMCLGARTNKYDLLCPREGCGCLILKKGVARWVEETSVELEPSGQRVIAPFMPMPTSSDKIAWWLIEPNAMAFENIGFSKTTDAPNMTTVRRKFLSCADCDLGPLGWCMEGGTEFWLVCDRVGYRV